VKIVALLQLSYLRKYLRTLNRQKLRPRVVAVHGLDWTRHQIPDDQNINEELRHVLAAKAAQLHGWSQFHVIKDQWSLSDIQKLVKVKLYHFLAVLTEAY